MNISVIGLGYVGYTMVACLSQKNKIFCVDIDNNKIELLKNGKSSIFEPGINKLLKDGNDKGNIIATNDMQYAILNSDITFITVGTPSKDDGNLNVSQVYEISKKIGEIIKLKEKYHTIVIKSTTPPGTNKIVTEIIEKSSKKSKDVDFAVVSNPEFLREGSAIDDFYYPEIVLIGTNSAIAKNKLKDLYCDINGEFIFADINVVEIMKYVNNSYHALKVCFANEIGNICKSLNIDGNKVMEIFCKDKKLNISSYYFKPGFAFGGSCLPKDLEALKTLSKQNNINSHIINSINNSNMQHIDYGIKLIESFNSNNIGILGGLSFKSNSDDLRHSPILTVIKELQIKKYNISIYDNFLKLNDNYINKIKEVVDTSTLNFKYDINELINSSDIIVLSNKEKNYNSLCNLFPKKIFIDLCGQFVDNNYPNVYSMCK